MFDSPPPSNKLVFGTSFKGPGPALNMYLDRLTFTCNPQDDYERKHICGVLMDAKKDGFASWVQYGSSNKTHKINVHLHTKTGGSYLFQADPKKSSDPFLRCDGNPAKCGPAGIAELKLCTEPMFKHGWSTVLTKARITRYDVALDITGIHIDDLVIAPTSCVKSFVVLSQAGKIQTVCYGSTQSRAIYRIYDKAQQLKDTTGLILPGPLTRLERSIRTGIGFSKLPLVDNPFSKLLVTDLSFGADGLPPGLLPLFKIASRSMGTSACLALLPKHYRKAIRDAMKAHACYWWNPTKIWAAWDQQLTDLGLVTNVHGVHVSKLKEGVHFGGA